jgi:hypothetical protein
MERVSVRGQGLWQDSGLCINGHSVFFFGKFLRGSVTRGYS